jgi:U3 small nucleolar RNA-associated protein 10
MLKTLSAVSSSAKAQILLPTIQTLTTQRQVVDEDSSSSQEYTGLLVSCFDASVVNDLNDAQSDMWDVLTSVLRKLFTGKIPCWLRALMLITFIGVQHSSRLILSRSLEQGLFTGLKLERKIALCSLLLDISSHDADAVRTNGRILNQYTLNHGF